MRPTWLLVGPGIAILLLLFGRRPARSTLFVAFLVCLGLAATLLPWTIRNMLITGHLVSTTLWVGPSLYDGINPHANGDSDMRFFDDENLMSSMSEYDMNYTYKKRAWEYAGRSPRSRGLVGFHQAVAVLEPSTKLGTIQQGVDSSHRLAVVCTANVVLNRGAWFSRHNLWLLILTAAPIFYFAGLHLLFVGSLRYRLPAEYPLAVLAAVGFVRLCGLRSDGHPVNQVIFSDR